MVASRSPFAVRNEPGKLPAAMLALMVHAGFFAIIIFGVSWQVRHPVPLTAELWNTLPPVRNAPVVEPEPPKPAPEPEPEPEPIKKAPPPKIEPLKVPTGPSKAEIALKAKQEKAEKEKLEREKQEKEKKLLAEKQRKEEEAKKRAAKAAEERAKAEAAEREAAARAVYSKALSDYSAKIGALIRSRANIPDTVSGKPIVQIRLRLLVNGVVFDSSIIQPSGNRVYDEAVERAINGIKTWPEPDNPQLLGGRRELILKIEHER